MRVINRVESYNCKLTFLSNQHGNECFWNILENIAILASSLQLRLNISVESANTEQACWGRQDFGKAPMCNSILVLKL